MLTPYENVYQTRPNRLLYQNLSAEISKITFNIAQDRGSKLSNLLGDNDFLPPKLGSFEKHEKSIFLQKMSGNYAMGNIDLTRFIFKSYNSLAMY